MKGEHLLVDERDEETSLHVWEQAEVVLRYGTDLPRTERG